MLGRRSLGPDLLPLIDDIDKLRRKRHQGSTSSTMAVVQERQMKDWSLPGVVEAPSCIVLTDQARNYELKSYHFNNLPQFHGIASEDPLTFLHQFSRMVQTFPTHGVPEEALKLRCFPYTLKDAADRWFMSIPAQTIHTWKEIHDRFVAKFYTYAKSATLRKQICNFIQADGEPFHEAWDRFQTLLIQCPHHGLPVELQHSYFYDGLTPAHQTMVDNAAGGALGEKTARQIQEIFESLSTNSLQKGVRGDFRGVQESKTITEISKQLTFLQKQMGQLSMNAQGSAMQASTYHPPHSASYEMMEQANAMNDYHPRMRNDPYSNTYNPGWRDRPYLSTVLRTIRALARL